MKQLESGINVPLTSSMGRLFDGVASLLGICHQISYEGQAAIELEALADPREDSSYPVEFEDGLIFQAESLIHAILSDQLSGTASGIISTRFHNTLAELVLQAALSIRETHHLRTVALSGGVWQNRTLLERSITRLHSADFQVLLHHQVPANDGGISLGQAVIGQRYLQV
jgi:hydrogenase maturation protein HypF